MRHYGWTREQTIAFGDGGNDADMLAFAGIGVAMGNATEPAKAAADYITDDVDHDGIMNALKHFNVLELPPLPLAGGGTQRRRVVTDPARIRRALTRRGFRALPCVSERRLRIAAALTSPLRWT